MTPTPPGSPPKKPSGARPLPPSTRSRTSLASSTSSPPPPSLPPTFSSPESITSPLVPPLDPAEDSPPAPPAEIKAVTFPIPSRTSSPAPHKPRFPAPRPPPLKLDALIRATSPPAPPSAVTPSERWGGLRRAFLAQAAGAASSSRPASPAPGPKSPVSPVSKSKSRYRPGERMHNVVQEKSVYKLFEESIAAALAISSLPPPPPAQAPQGDHHSASASSKRSRKSTLPTDPLLALRGALLAGRGRTRVLPLHTSVLSALSTPFLRPPGQFDHEAAWLALDCLSTVLGWEAADESQEVARWCFLLRALAAPDQDLQDRARQALQPLVSTRSVAPHRPNTPLALLAIVGAAVRALAALEPWARTRSWVETFVEELGAGRVIKLDEGEVALEYGFVPPEEGGAEAWVVLEGLTQVLGARREVDTLLLSGMLDRSFPPRPARSDPLTTLLHRRIVRRLSALALPLLDLSPSHRIPLLHLLRSRTLPFLYTLTVDEAAEEWTAAAAAALLLDKNGELLGEMWAGDAGRKSVAEAVEELLETQPLDDAMLIVRKVLLDSRDDIANSVAQVFLPSLPKHLPWTPSPSLTSLLDALSFRHPAPFHKPIFTLSSSSSATALPALLLNLLRLARSATPRHLLLRDPEMIAVALLADSTKSKAKSESAPALAFAPFKLGQSLLAVELILAFRDVARDERLGPDEKKAIATFCAGLETRIAVVVTAKEQARLVPFSQRTLLCRLILEMRLCTRSISNPPWLALVVKWATQAFVGAPIRESVNPFVQDEEPPALHVVPADLDEIGVRRGKIRAVYKAAQQESGSVDGENLVRARQKTLSSLDEDPAAAPLELLVALFHLLSTADLQRVGEVAWTHGLGCTCVGPAAFLLMQLGEKDPEALSGMIERDLQSSDATVRRAAVSKLATLFGWRHQILTQPYLPDKTRRRPFRTARQAIGFVPAEVGHTRYVQPDVPEATRLKLGASLPIEVRRRLEELGWDTQERTTDEALSELERTPITILPSAFLERGTEELPSSHLGAPATAPEMRPLIRRGSSAIREQPDAKRRAVLVPAIGRLLPQLADLLSDADSAVSFAARDAILLMMRDDPTLFVRPLLEDLSGEPDAERRAIARIAQLAGVAASLPPALAHHLWNHLAGLLKTRVRERPGSSAELFVLVLPPAARFSSLVSDFSVNSLRKNKIDSLFLNVAKHLDPAAPIVLRLCSDAGQNIFLLSALAAGARDTYNIKKFIAEPALLPVERGGPRVGRFAVPHRRPNAKSQLELLDYDSFSRGRYSLLVARSWLLAVTRTLCSLNRNWNDHDELARLISGINVILTAHGQDVNVVVHALQALMAATTRFRRLVSASNSFALFAPSLFTLYAEARPGSAVRLAVEHAWQRFFAVHQEAFAFQSLLSIAPVVLHSSLEKDADRRWIADSLYALVSSLASYGDGKDPAGLRGLNDAEEREALVNSVNDAPEILLGPLHGRTEPEDTRGLSSLLGNRFEDRSFPLDSVVRLFVTIIAYDPLSTRAELFLRLFRLLLPNLYASSAASLLREAVEALSSVIFRAGRRARIHLRDESKAPAAAAADSDSASETTTTAETSFLSGKPSVPSDLASVRREYISLVVSFAAEGGRLGTSAMRTVLELVKASLRDAPQQGARNADGLFRELFRADATASVKQTVAVLRSFEPIFTAFAAQVDFSSTLDALGRLCTLKAFARDRDFCRALVDGVCGPALDLCAGSAANGTLLTSPMRQSTVSLIVGAIGLPLVDALSVLERQPRSPALLAGVVLPLTLALPATAAEHDDVWVRIVLYALVALVKAGENVAGVAGLGAEGRQPKKGEAPDTPHKQAASAARSAAAVLLITLQIVKVVLVRGGLGQAQHHAEVVYHLLSVMRKSLARGSGRFASLHPNDGSTSPSFPTSRFSPSPPSSPAYGVLNVWDFHLWSFLEFALSFRNALTLHLYTFVHEKLAELGALSGAGVASPVRQQPQQPRRASLVPRVRRSPSPSRRASALSATAGGGDTTPSRRTSASADVFSSSPRFSLRPGIFRTTSSPATGPIFSSTPLPATSSPAPAPNAGNVPRIRHLGPTLLPPIQTTSLLPTSPSRSLGCSLESVLIRTPALVRASTARVRVVQALTGYAPLLVEGGEGEVRAWGREEALRRVAEETGLLVEEEFADVFKPATTGEFVMLDGEDVF